MKLPSASGKEPEIRRVQLESLRWLVDLAKRAGVKRLVVNGSFVTDVPEPNDVDCVLLVDDHFPTDPQLEKEIEAGLPFLTIELVRQEAFDYFVKAFFATDRHDNPKGMIEVSL